MRNFKSCKWGYGIVTSFIIGLSGCMMDGQNSPQVDYSTHTVHKVDAQAAKGKKVAKTSTSSAKSVPQKTVPQKTVPQKTVPGPKQTAAPQLPVIQ